MDDRVLVPVVLSGGGGSRLWPLSREHYPKQCLALVNDRTLLQETVGRFQGLSGLAPPVLVCNEAHRFLVAEQLRQIECAPSAILLEPEGRNTAPAVAVAALEIQRHVSDAVMLVLPADHLIEDTAQFQAAVAMAAEEAATGALVTFGIVPDRPETGYGYIRFEGQSPVRPVRGFVEKPDLVTARGYIEDGHYLWNSGMFVFRASAYLEELGRYAPRILDCAKAAMAGAVRDMDFVRLDQHAFIACPEDSVDYAVMEHTRRARVVPLEAGWSDIGSWASLCEALPADADGNTLAGDVLIEQVRGSYIRADSRLVAAIGVEDHVIVETADAVLVAHRDHAQDVKRIVERLKLEGREERLVHRRVYRPWGWYETIAGGERFQVKLICVKPGASLSLQMHHHRAEHWVVVAGTAKVQRGDEAFLLGEDESTYIPVGTTHRLENPGKIPLHLVEVQSGGYLGEDDIVRLDDRYGR